MAEESEYHEPRRKDRAVTGDEWIRAFLDRATIGNLATVEGDQPFINSNLFVYDAERHAIYIHTARSGRTRTNVDGKSRGCFSVSEMGRLLPADVALEMSVEYAGVAAFGPTDLVTDRQEQEHALYLLLKKYFAHLEAGRDYRRITQDELDRTSVFRLDIERWMGKKKEVGEFAGAFQFGWPPDPEASPDFHSTIENALGQLPRPDGKRFVELFRHGSLQLEAYAPRGTDPQTPHSRDEVYVVVCGQGQFHCGNASRPFGPGDILFVPAGIEHRFSNFSEDFFTWAIFYGPEGGEGPSKVKG